MAISYSNALEYFKAENHIRGQVWADFPEAMRKGSIVQATRVLSRALNSDITDETIDEDDPLYRPDYAVYEQALWMMENGVIANGERSAPTYLSGDPEKPDNVRDSQRALLSPEALRWLGVTAPRVVLTRG